MSEHPVLSQVALGHSPMIDRHRTITALRLTVFPARPETPIDGDGLLEMLAECWPAEAGRLSLNIADEALLGHLLQADLPPHVMLEVPVFMAVRESMAQALKQQYARGTTLLIKGVPMAPLSRELLPCFGYSIIDLADDRRFGSPPPGGVARNIPHVQAGVRSRGEMAEAFARDAIAVLGWPIDEPVAEAKASTASSRAAKSGASAVTAVIELLNRVDRGEHIDRLEAVVKTEPTLAYRLLKYINSPLFGLRMEVTSFGHAIMLLGHQRIKRWLALLLVAGSGEPADRPLAYAAVRRGLLMEALGRDAGLDDGPCGELFVCGVFSLLDRMLQQPFDTLLAKVPTSAAVRDALSNDSGPFQPYLALARAVELSLIFDIRDAADALMMAPQTVNRALLKALVGARQLD